MMTINELRAEFKKYRAIGESIGVALGRTREDWMSEVNYVTGIFTDGEYEALTPSVWVSSAIEVNAEWARQAKDPIRRRVF